jgi:cytosine/adenosine deaminase-related metal-dependent hydrolase
MPPEDVTQRTLFRGGWVLSMVPGQEPFRGDVLIEGDRIAAVSTAVDVPAAADVAVVDARERIVLPGLVDSHRHLWQSALRGIACDWTLGEYFARMRGRLGAHFRPEDSYAGTLLGAVEALDAGITTVVDWSHNINSPDHADAAWQALVDAGGRALFAYGASNAQALGEPSPHTRDVARLHGRPDPSGRVTLGMAVRGPEFSGPGLPAADLALARELGLPVTMHVGGGLRGAGRHVAAMADTGLLGPDLTFVHCNLLADDELDAMADTGCRASVSPEVEANMGHGPAATGRLRSRGIPTGLSADVCTNVGGDLFGAMRVALALERGAAHAAALARGEALDRVQMTARDVLAMATLDGARACGLDDRVGSLEPGKQADLLLLRTDAPNLAPLVNPVGAAVSAAGPHNVDAVLVAGRWVKRDGRLVEHDVHALLERAGASQRHLLDAAGVRAEPWCPPGG